MAGRQRPIENTDYENPELRGLIDFSALPTGGYSVQPVTEREFANDKEGQAAYEAFMREPIVLKIHSTTDKNEPLVADVALNGVKCPMPREKPIKVPRAFVEVLARSQNRAYEQERVPDPDAAEGYKTRRTTGVQFPFSVLHDPSPKGRAWLQRITHESA